MGTHRSKEPMTSLGFKKTFGECRSLAKTIGMLFAFLLFSICPTHSIEAVLERPVTIQGDCHRMLYFCTQQVRNGDDTKRADATGCHILVYLARTLVWQNCQHC